VIVVILHCHFERGGVTQVVENNVRALRDTGRFERIILASGNRCDGLSSETRNAVECIKVDAFDYDTRVFTADDLVVRREQMMHALRTQFAQLGVGVENTVLHWHNHSLGKNTAVPAVIRSLADEGWRLLLQIHDFAEDHRPENYGRLISAIGANCKRDVDCFLYPQAETIHYATLTRADAEVLCRLGVSSDSVHCLPNGVTVPHGSSLPREEARAGLLRAFSLPADVRWSLYPVRGIRRKNVGELLMLARWAGENRFFGLTLMPATPQEKRSYHRWKKVAAEVSKQTVFDAGENPSISFLQNMLAADYVISTSVAEGFGMAFLEPWLMGRGVIARRLNTVADDFEKCGMNLGSFYEAVLIPGDKSWIDECRTETKSAEAQAWSNLPKAFQPHIHPFKDEPSGAIDFAKLIPRRQIEVLQRMSRDAGFENEAKQLSATLVSQLNQDFSVSVLKSNARVVQEHYSAEQAGQRLLNLYEGMINGHGVWNPAAQRGSAQQDFGSPEDAVTMPECGIDLISAFRPYHPCRTEKLR